MNHLQATASSSPAVIADNCSHHGSSGHDGSNAHKDSNSSEFPDSRPQVGTGYSLCDVALRIAPALSNRGLSSTGPTESTAHNPHVHNPLKQNYLAATRSGYAINSIDSGSGYTASWPLRCSRSFGKNDRDRQMTRLSNDATDFRHTPRYKATNGVKYQLHHCTFQYSILKQLLYESEFAPDADLQHRGNNIARATQLAYSELQPEGERPI